MSAKFLLLTLPRWVGFQLEEEGKQETRQFKTIAEALAYARTLPGAEGAPFVVLDEQGQRMAELTV